MAYIDSANTMFFLPKPVSAFADPKTDGDLSQYFPATKNWERGIFYTRELNAPYYIARAPNERAVVIGCSGLNTHTLLSPTEVKRLNDAGISIVWMALPKIENGQPLMDSYLKLAKDFFTSKNSPARVLINNDCPRYALTYSTGGQIFFHLLHDPETNRKLRSIFTGAVHVSPYLDTAHASRDHSHPIVQTLFKEYMSLNPDVPPNKRAIANAYMKWNDYWDPATTGTPANMDSTCGQILELQDRGQRLTSKGHFNVEACKAIPSIFVIGDKDNFACPLTAMDIADMIGAEKIIARGGFHDPLRSHPHLLQHFIKKVDDCVTQFEKEKAQRVYISPVPLPDLELEPIPYGLTDRLRDGASIALKRGTRLLNAAACLL